MEELIMEWKRFVVGPVQENTYILHNNKKEALIFDPGANGKKINQWIEEKELKPLAILLTHAHFDHIGALEEVRRKWNVPVYVHQNEEDWLENPKKNGSAYFMQEITARKADHLINGEGELVFSSFRLNVFETPGHSPGSVSYYVKDVGLIFSGDALFAGSIGRTDLYGGDQKTLLKSIHEKLLSLPEETVVLSGHGPETTIEREMDINPFLSGF